MDAIQFWAPLNKVEDNGDGTCTVFGLLTDAGPDRDKQGMNQDWLDQAVPQWYGEGANIREMHPHGTTAAGVGIGLTRADDGGWWLASKIVDPIAVRKCLSEPPVYRGYSIGIRDYKLDMTKADRPNGEVVAGYISEASLADRPSNPRTLFTMVKNDGPGKWNILEKPAELELQVPVDPVPPVFGDGLDKYVSAERRRTYAKQGIAMKNGDFPIPDRGHLTAAIGRLKNYKGDKAAARRHIRKRARALGVAVPSLGKTIDLLAEYAALPALRKYDEAADIAGAVDAIACIARLIQSEAAALATGRMEEMRDISLLLEAGRALEYFKCREEQQAQEGPTGDGTDSDSEDVSPGAALFYMDEPGLVKIDQGVTMSDPATPPADPASKTKTKTDTGGQPDLSAMIEAAVTKAVEPIRGELSDTRAQLAKVLESPQSGGPVQTRTGTQTQLARTAEIQNIQKDVNELLTKAEQIGNSDPVLAQGYRDEAEALQRRLLKMN